MNSHTPPDEAITISEFAARIADLGRHVKNKWHIVAIISALGALAGLFYALKKPVYTAVSTFVLEESSKMGSLGQYAGLASLAGVDLNSQSGLFQGDNILELYKSRTMIEKALLSEGEFNHKKQLLIERYIDFNDLREKWKSKDQIINISFTGNPDNFSRTQDSIITDLVKKIDEKWLDVKKLDKKLSIIVVEVSGKDELFAKEFNNRLVETVNNFYIQTKTKKSYQNVVVLQHQADSVKAVLNSSISGVAYASDATPNANPQMQNLKVPGQRKQIDVQASTAVYGEIIKNLEIAKISLRQDIPLIQVIDQPVLPLTDDHLSKIKGLIAGLFIGMLISVFWLCIKELFYRPNNYNSKLANERQ